MSGYEFVGFGPLSANERIMRSEVFFCNVIFRALRAYGVLGDRRSRALRAMFRRNPGGGGERPGLESDQAEASLRQLARVLRGGAE